MHAVVVGIANLQVFLPVDQFPHDYEPTRYLPGQITTTVGGVGFNVARTIAALGDTVSLLCPLIVLTLGAGGSLALTPEMTRAVRTPAALIGPIANTTGAGDTFMGALLHYHLSARQPLAQALTHASAAAASALDAGNSLSTY